MSRSRASEAWAISVRVFFAGAAAALVTLAANVGSASNASSLSTSPILLGIECGSPSMALGLSFDGTSWTTQPLPGSTPCSGGGAALAITSSGQGVALLGGANGPVQFAIWSAGAWTPPQQLGTVNGTFKPAITASGVTAQAVYTDFLNNHLHYAAFSGNAWNPSDEPVGGSAQQASTFIGSSIVAIGGNATVAYPSAPSDMVTTSDRIGGTWGSPEALPRSTNVGPPAIVALTSGPELMLVVPTQGPSLASFTRTAGVWSGEVQIPTSVPAPSVALLALPGGDALLVAPGSDHKLYWAHYSAGSWTALTALPIPSNIPVSAAIPSLAAGVFGDIAELVFLEDRLLVGPFPGGGLHMRYSTSGWSVPIVMSSVSGSLGMSGVAIASMTPTSPPVPALPPVAMVILAIALMAVGTMFRRGTHAARLPPSTANPRNSSIHAL